MGSIEMRTELVERGPARISEAKREQTRERWLKTAVEMLRQGRRLS